MIIVVIISAELSLFSYEKLIGLILWIAKETQYSDVMVIVEFDWIQNQSRALLIEWYWEWGGLVLTSQEGPIKNVTFNE